MRFFSVFGLLWLISQPLSLLKAQTLKDTLQIQTIQIYGQKTGGKFSETRTKIDSVTLARSITIRLSELLSQNTPVFIKEYGRGAMATASFRGTAPSHTKVNWNGLELNSPMLGMVDFSLIPVYFTEEVKLLHGSSSLYESAGALGGTIKLDNRANWSNTLSGKLLSGFGSYHTLDEFGQLNIGNKKIQSKSAIFYNASDNDFSYTNKLNADIDPETGNYIYSTEKNEHAAYKNYGILQEFYFQAGPRQTLSLKTWIQHNERSIPQLLTNESNDAANINKQAENAWRSVAEWKYYGTKSRWSLLSAINVQNSTYQLENSINGSANQLVIDSEANIHSFVNKLTFRYQINESTVLLTGLDANLHRVNSANNLPWASLTGYDQSRVENSLYARIEKQINAKWSTVFMLREEIIDFKHKGLLPLLKISFRPNENKPLIFYADVAKNSHQPTLNDLYFVPGGNSDLRPEKGPLFDFGSATDFSVGSSQFQTELSLFYSAISDWIIWLPTFQGYWEPINLEKVASRGLEANAAWNGHISKVSYGIKANYAYTHTVNISEGSPAYGKQLPYIPEHSANINLHLSYSRYFFDWMWNYYSKRFTTTANNEETVSDYLYPYFMNNLHLGMNFQLAANRLTAECRVLNLFNEDYRTVLQRPMPGRNYQIVLRYDF